jgi:monofunctional biosynthetic peptidoglycan transglycosylase
MKVTGHGNLHLDITPDQRADEEEPAMPRRLKAGSLSHIARRAGLVLVVLLVLPYLLIPVYALPFTRPVSTLMLSELFLLRGYDRQWVDLDDISPNLVRAVMMSEDGQFCAHGGVDWVQMRGVVQDALDGEQTRGASTISMQTAKNLFLWNGRFFVRKILELPLAMTSDFIWSKRRMMEIYLNVAEWGPGIYGAEAAAQHHFKTSAAKLSSSQAALLAVALPNPFTRVASKPGRGMRRLAGVVERRARGSGDYIKCIYE